MVSEGKDNHKQGPHMVSEGENDNNIIMGRHSSVATFIPHCIGERSAYGI